MNETRMTPVVLYVDDERNNRLVFHHTLRGVEARLASSAEEGLELLARERIDILLADLRMPEMNGVELVRTVRARYPHLPCFIVTGYPDDPELRGVREEALVEGIFVKPWDPDELLAAFEQVLQRPPR